MNTLIADIREFVNENIGTFHKDRLDSLRKLKLNHILRRKNPYLFKAKNIFLSQDFVKFLLDAHLSSQEETIFGNFLEELAIFVNSKIYGGWKSAAQGIDLEFNKDNNRYIVTIKSGPNWGNSSQVRKMREDFTKAKLTLRTSNSRLNIIAVNGCCYGRNSKPDKGDYYKFCGQKFWHFISGSQNLYLEIIKPLGHKAKEKNEEFLIEYAQIVNQFTEEFTHRFMKDSQIDWDSLVKFNSASE